MAFDGLHLVDELAQALDPGRWVLVGGLMVHAHSRIAGIPNNRPTDDADVVVEVQTTYDYVTAAESVRSLGFTPHESLDHNGPIYRFSRGTEQIDLMSPDRGLKVRFKQRPVLQVPASSSAMKNAQEFTTATGTTVRIPNLSGALALKGAAYTTPSVNPMRHVQDALVLFACADLRGAPPPSKSQKAEINKLFRGFDVPESWSLLDDMTAARAARAIASFRPGWSAPPFLPSRAPARRSRT